MAYLDKDRIRARRRSLFLTQRAVADSSGLSIGTIKSIERGDRIDRGFDTIRRLARALDTDPSELGSSPARVEDPPASPDSGRPSIVFLPFDNHTGSEALGYAGFGIAEDLAARAKSWRYLEVIEAGRIGLERWPDVREVGRALGVRYVVHGSVEEWGVRLRARARLSDTRSGRRLFTDRCDASFDSAQVEISELTQRIVAQVGIDSQEQARQRGPGSVSAWDRALEASWHAYKQTEEDHRRARTLFEEAIKLDPDLVMAHYGLALIHLVGILTGWSTVEAAEEGLIRSAETALRLDGQDPYARVAYGFACRHKGQRDEAIASFRCAVELNPSMAVAHAALAEQLAYCGDAAAAIEHVRQAIRLSPRDLLLWWFHYVEAVALFHEREYEQAIRAASRSRAELPAYPATFGIQAAAYAYLEQMEQARALVREGLGRWPGISLALVRALLATDDPDLTRRLVDGLRRAGVPER